MNARNDEAVAQRWRGPLFKELRPEMSGFELVTFAQILDVPRSVTFPICALCSHVVWDWPHYEEEVPKNAICNECAEEEETSQR
jgi:hypothetical protein